MNAQQLCKVCNERLLRQLYLLEEKEIVLCFLIGDKTIISESNVRKETML